MEWLYVGVTVYRNDCIWEWMYVEVTVYWSGCI